MKRDNRKTLPAAWRSPFEASFGHDLAHVEMVYGPETDATLAAAGAAAQALDANTILLSKRLLEQPRQLRMRALGHELAHTIQLARGGSDATEYLEVEASLAAEAAMLGVRWPVLLGGTGPLAIPASAILLNEAANTYFKTYKKCSHNQGRAYLDIADGDRLVLSPMVFEKLLDVMIAKKELRHFVIFSHGTFDGLLMALAPEHLRDDKEYGTVSAKSHVLITLMQMDEVFADAQAAKDADAGVDQLLKNKATPDVVKAANDAALKMWQALLKKIGRPDPVSSSQDAARLVGQWVNDRLKSLAMTETRVRELLGKMRQVRAKNIQLLEIRSCFVGSKRHTLHVLRHFFNAEIVGGPVEFSAFGHLDVVSDGGNLGQDRYDQFSLDHTGARKYTTSDGLTQGEVALAHKLVNSHEAETYAAATDAKAMQEWVSQFLGAAAPPSLSNIPVHFLATEQTSVPGSMDWLYWNNIEYAFPLDTDDIPASPFTAGAVNP